MLPSAHARGREMSYVISHVFFLVCYVIKQHVLLVISVIRNQSTLFSLLIACEIKMVVTSEYVKLRVLSLLRQGKKISETVRELQDVDGMKID